MVEITVSLVPVGNTTTREIAKLRTEVQDAAHRMRGVERVAPVMIKTPEGSKGIGEAIDALFVAVPASMITSLFDLIKAVLLRPGQPKEVEVEVTAIGAKLKFDPRRVSLDEMAAFVKQIRPGGPA